VIFAPTTPATPTHPFSSATFPSASVTVRWWPRRPTTSSTDGGRRTPGRSSSPPSPSSAQGQPAIRRPGRRAADRRLEPGHLPEGGRSPDGWAQTFRGGAAYLSVRTGCPVVPVHLDGTRHILPKGGRGVRRTRTTITFGTPLRPDEGRMPAGSASASRRRWPPWPTRSGPTGGRRVGRPRPVPPHHCRAPTPPVAPLVDAGRAPQPAGQPTPEWTGRRSGVEPVPVVDQDRRAARRRDTGPGRAPRPRPAVRVGEPAPRVVQRRQGGRDPPTRSPIR